jgi:uncharacterized protein (TIGR02391 family)
VPPTLPPQRAIELLRQQLERLDDVVRLRRDDPEVTKWEVTTENILHGAFGKPDGESHQNTQAFHNCRSGFLHSGMTDADVQQDYTNDQRRRKALLKSFIEQLNLAPPAAQVSPGQYRFHPEIERVSGQLFRHGHYKYAALEAYIRVINEVKTKSGLPLDGDSLVNQAFGCDNRTTVIQFNAHQTEAEKDEQRGFMLLFKGIVGLRNSKEHSNRLFNDPQRAHEHLALASLLMRLLEIASVNRNP